MRILIAFSYKRAAVKKAPHPYTFDLLKEKTEAFLLPRFFAEKSRPNMK